MKLCYGLKLKLCLWGCEFKCTTFYGIENGVGACLCYKTFFHDLRIDHISPNKLACFMQHILEGSNLTFTGSGLTSKVWLRPERHAREPTRLKHLSGAPL